MPAVDGPLVEFFQLVPNARKPQKADRAVGGTIPARALRYCEAITGASGFGWYVFLRRASVRWLAVAVARGLVDQQGDAARGKSAGDQRPPSHRVRTRAFEYQAPDPDAKEGAKLVGEERETVQRRKIRGAEHPRYDAGDWRHG